MRTWIAAVAIAGAVLVAGCGDDDDAPEPAGQNGAPVGAKVIDPALADAATGTVTYCTGKDTSGAQRASFRAFNRQFEDQGLRARLLEFPESADQQRNQFIQRQRAESGECDIFYSDVIWTAEFATQEWLYDLTPLVEERAAEFIPSTLETTEFEGRYWGMPKQTDAGFLYYRTDQVDEAPATWQAVYELAERNDGIVYQGAAYEGLTVDFLEIAFANGGAVLSDDGTASAFDSPENVEALRFMAEGIRDGAAPRAVVTYMESRRGERSRPAGPRSCATGPTRMRKGSRIRDDFAVTPLPAFEGAGRAGILGGHNLVVSAYADNPGGAVALIEYLTSPEVTERDAAEYSLAPALSATYDDPDVREALPFAAELKQAVEQARPRPVTPLYPQVSEAIYSNVNEALSGAVSPEAANPRRRRGDQARARDVLRPRHGVVPPPAYRGDRMAAPEWSSVAGTAAPASGHVGCWWYAASTQQGSGWAHRRWGTAPPRIPSLVITLALVSPAAAPGAPDVRDPRAGAPAPPPFPTSGSSAATWPSSSSARCSTPSAGAARWRDSPSARRSAAAQALVTTKVVECPPRERCGGTARDEPERVRLRSGLE